MFKQEKNVANFFLFAQRHELPLQTKAGGVIDGAELEDGDQILFATNLRGFPQTGFFTRESAEATESLCI